MNKILHRALALLLVCLLLTGAAVPGFAASVARVTKLTLKENTSTSIQLGWKAVSKADGYVVERRAGQSEWKTAKETAKTVFTDTSVKPGKVYSYRVKAFVKNGKAKTFGEASAALTAMTKPETVSEVQMVSAASGAAAVTLKWPAAAGATSYLVFKKDVTTNQKFTQLLETKKESCLVQFSAAPGAVAFKVKAVAKSGELSESAGFSPALSLNLKPERVARLSAKKITPTSVTLTWDPADGASSYEVFLRNEANFEYELVETVTGTTCTVKGLDSLTPHYFAVKSVASYGGQIQRTGFSPAYTATTAFNGITGLKFSLKDGNKAVLTWDKLSSADGYEIEKSADGKSDWQKLADVKSASFEVSAKEPGGVLEKGKQYFYRVRAYANEGGETQFTAYSEIVKIQPVPDTPVITRAGTASQHGICLEWTAVSGADGYEIQFCSPQDGKWRELVSGEMRSKQFKTYVNEDGVKTVYYLDQGLTTTDTYQYRVRAFVQAGEERSFTEPSNAWSQKYIYSPEPQAYYADTFQSIGIAGYLYDPVEKVFFTAEDPWQRNYGFNTAYDVASQHVFIQYDTAPIRFTCHEGEKWMIQPWKGQYGFLFYGGEIGVYKQYNPRDVEHYDCAEDKDQLMMEMTVSRRQLTGKWSKEIHRPYGSYWWVTGFKLGFVRFVSSLRALRFDTYRDLRIEARITMMDYDMRNAFVAAVNEINVKERRFTIAEYGKNDLDLYITFN